METQTIVTFNNGTYNLNTGFFDDRQNNNSYSTGYDFVEFAENDISITEVNNFFRTLFPDEHVRKYMLMFLASCISGLPHEIFNVWKGDGSNGKSMLLILLKHTFGGYFGIIKSSLIAHSNKKEILEDNLCQLDKLSGKRLLVAPALEEDCVIDHSIIKYTFSEEHKQQTKLVVICNELKSTHINNTGLKKRTVIVPFETHFVMQKSKTHEMSLRSHCHNQEREIESNIDIIGKIPKWKSALMWLLITKYYPAYTIEEMDEHIRYIHHLTSI